MGYQRNTGVGLLLRLEWLDGAACRPSPYCLLTTHKCPRSHLPACLQLRVLRWVRQLSTDQLVLQALEQAGAVGYVVAQLRQQQQQQQGGAAQGGSAVLQADALGALHNLCQLSRPRQEQAAEQQAVLPLVALVQHPVLLPHLAAAAAAAGEEGGPAAGFASSRNLAVSLLCGFGELPWACATCATCACSIS